MAKGYWVVNLEVTDIETYKQYQAFVGPFLAEAGGRFIVRGGERLAKEGDVRTRTVVVEFPSYAQAVAAYESEAYQTGMQQRLAAGAADFVIVDGFDG
jgi:uncharacterized protein (DUF1330 family)